MPDEKQEPSSPPPKENPKPPMPKPPEPEPMTLSESYKEAKKPRPTLAEQIQEALKIKRR